MKTILMLLSLLLQQEEPAISHGPYLQSVTTTSIVICWRMEPEGAATVEWGRTRKLGKKTASPLGTKHEVTLTGLKPGTRYFYRVGDREGEFKTKPEGTEPFTFVLYGDGRTGHKNHRTLAKLMAKYSPDLAVHSGDLVENGHNSKQWKQFFELSGPLLRNTPFYPSLGNHERNSPKYFDFFVLPGNERYYSFDYGSAHFIILDSNRSWKDDPKQIEWVKKDLAATKKPFKFAIFHHPLLSASAWKSRRGSSERMYKRWGKIFEEGGLTAALQGHNHNYQRAKKRGVLYITSGGGGAPLYPTGDGLPETKFMKVAHHFVLFHIDKTSFKAEVIDVKGKIIDRFGVSAY